ncbi:non-ribosomal peptide synthetase, partial [Roseibium sp. RKSG952]|uniref:non-ribosomal peptide synthetase n=1 Tax=Roseibium sp. RKSG952 TaxID=2529384 RepID=UPI0012BCC1DE
MNKMHGQGTKNPFSRFKKDAASNKQVHVAERLPLTLNQERLWFLNRLDQTTEAGFHVAKVWRVNGEIDVDVLRSAFDQLVEKHDALRVVFKSDEETGPYQSVGPVSETRISLKTEDLAGNTNSEVKDRVRSLLDQPFDLETGPLFRGWHLASGKNDGVLVFCAHSAVLDNASLALLMQDLFARYVSLLRKIEIKTAEGHELYSEFIKAQSRAGLGADLTGALKWWKWQLAGVPAAISLPFDRPRPENAEYVSSFVGLKLPKQTTTRLRGIAHETDTSMFVILQTAFSLLLARLGAGPDVVMGTHVSGRGSNDTCAVCGPFENLIAIRSTVDLGRSFQDQLASNRADVLDAYTHGVVPYAAVLEAVDPPRSMRHEPLLQVAFNLCSPEHETRSHTLPDMLSVEPFPIDGGQHSVFELMMDLEDNGSEISGTVVFSKALFEQQTIQRLVRAFKQVLDYVGNAPSILLHDIPLLGDADYSQVVRGFNATAQQHPREKTFVDLFSESVAKWPKGIAVAEGKKQVSYEELDAQSNRLARVLIDRGVGPETIVGVCLDRSIELIVSMLAVFKAGGAYMPIDPDYPEERIAFLLDDASVPVVLANTRAAERKALLTENDDRTTIIYGKDTEERLTAVSPYPIKADERLHPLFPDNLAYTIYTSGSTGKPKGVLIDHKEFRNFLFAISSLAPLSAADVVLSVTSSVFDVSLQDFCLPLVHGAKLVLADRNRLGSDDYVQGLFKKVRPTFMELTPSVARLMFAEGIPDSPELTLFIGSEVVDPGLADELGGKVKKLLNAYGPTEAVVNSVMQPLRKGLYKRTVPIGSPIENTTAYIVDRHFNPVPVGVFGELVIGGEQVTRGYTGRPGLTAEKFVADPFSNVPGARVYRTGDLVRWLPDGSIEYLGRIDTQVKIRGMRVELGEIEAVLAADDTVEQAVVLARKGAGDTTVDSELVAYLVPNSSSSVTVTGGYGSSPRSIKSDREVEILRSEDFFDLGALKARLKETLPVHMVPSRFITISHMPLTPSGKTDSKALPAAEGAIVQTAYQAPQNGIEKVVSDAFAELLRVERVGRLDNFFELGGNSLSAIRLVARIKASLNKSLLVREILESPTVADLSVRIDAAASSDGEVPLIAVGRDKPLPPSYQQERLWFLDQLDDRAGGAYHVEGAFRLDGPLDPGALDKALAKLVARQEGLRTVFASSEDGTPYQVVRQHSADTFGLVVEDGTDFSPEDLKARVRSLAQKRFDFKNGPLFRAHLIRLSEVAHILIIGGHHIIFDGWSIGVALKELGALYREALTGVPADLPKLPIQYADYAAWQRKTLSSSKMQLEKEWWKQELAGIPNVMDLPLDRPRPEVFDYSGRVVPICLERPYLDKLQEIALGNGATLFMVIETTLAVLLARVGAGNDIVIGTAVGGRPAQELENLCGYFVNTVPLRSQMALERRFLDQLTVNRAAILDAVSHDAVPFEAVVDAVSPTRSMSNSPIVQVMFTLQNLPDWGASLQLEDVTAVGYRSGDIETAQVDMAVVLAETKAGLEGRMSFASQLFDRSTAERLS